MSALAFSSPRACSSASLSFLGALAARGCASRASRSSSTLRFRSPRSSFSAFSFAAAFSSSVASAFGFLFFYPGGWYGFPRGSSLGVCRGVIFPARSVRAELTFLYSFFGLSPASFVGFSYIALLSVFSFLSVAAASLFFSSYTGWTTSLPLGFSFVDYYCFCGLGDVSCFVFYFTSSYFLVAPAFSPLTGTLGFFGEGFLSGDPFASSRNLFATCGSLELFEATEDALVFGGFTYVGGCFAYGGGGEFLILSCSYRESFIFCTCVSLISLCRSPSSEPSRFTSLGLITELSNFYISFLVSGSSSSLSSGFFNSSRQSF